jgi:hypothetical protein
MATFEDVARMAAELPDVTEGERYGNRTWLVGGKAFAWDRPFSKADIRRFGDQVPPDGDHRRLAGVRPAPARPAFRAVGHTAAIPVYQARGPALRFSKGALAKWSGVRGSPALPGGRAASSVRQAPDERGNGGSR